MSKAKKTSKKSTKPAQKKTLTTVAKALPGVTSVLGEPTSAEARQVAESFIRKFMEDELEVLKKESREWTNKRWDHHRNSQDLRDKARARRAIELYNTTMGTQWTLDGLKGVKWYDNAVSFHILMGDDTYLELTLQGIIHLPPLWVDDEEARYNAHVAAEQEFFALDKKMHEVHELLSRGNGRAMKAKMLEYLMRVTQEGSAAVEALEAFARAVVAGIKG